MKMKDILRQNYGNLLKFKLKKDWNKLEKMNKCLMYRKKQKIYSIIFTSKRV